MLLIGGAETLEVRTSLTLEVTMTMLMRFDPLREFDRVFDQAWSQTRQASVPMDAYRHGDSFVIHLDLPGVDPASIDLTVERNAMTITAERYWQPVDGDQVVASERRQGSFSRQLFLGDGLDSLACGEARASRARVKHGPKSH